MATKRDLRRSRTDWVRTIRIELISAGFSQLSMHALHDTLRNPQCRVSTLKPAFSALPLEHSRFVAEDAANGSFAQTPQFRHFGYAVVLLESGTGGSLLSQRCRLA